MEKKKEEIPGSIPSEEEDVEMEDTDEAFASLNALTKALNNPIHVKTSRVEIKEKTSSRWKLIDIEGKLDESILEVLDSNLNDESLTLGETSKTSANSFYSLPSCSSSFDGIIEPEALQNAEATITSLENQGPAGLVHLSSLSAAIGRPIRVWSSLTDASKKVGRTQNAVPVDVEYHRPREENSSPGHWTLRGNEEPEDVQGELNDCLFNVVADQVGGLAPELRSQTISRMRRNIKALARRITAIAERENCDSISLLIGGAAYNGTRPQDARVVLDNSQNGRCYPRQLQGHPRGHASHPDGRGPTDSAENYSLSGTKSAFLSREDQDAVAHLVLTTKEAQDAMACLNRGAESVALKLKVEQLEPGPLPKGMSFYDGNHGGQQNIRQLVMVLRHHQGKEKDPSADVFVHTFYPVLG